MKRAGNCVVDDEGYVWVNEVDGCRIWRFDQTGRPVLKLGDGKSGFQSDIADFDGVPFSWIYDMRRGALRSRQQELRRSDDRPSSQSCAHRGGDRKTGV